MSPAIQGVSVSLHIGPILLKIASTIYCNCFPIIYIKMFLNDENSKKRYFIEILIITILGISTQKNFQIFTFSNSACDPGHFRHWYSHRCFTCAVGEYSATINARRSCTPCPRQITTAQRGSTSSSQCNIRKWFNFLIDTELVMRVKNWKLQ